MAKFTKQTGMGGAWLKAEDVTNGTKITIVSEVVPVEGQYGTQNVGKVRVEGKDEALNMNFNKPTINALIDAFGEESKDWANKTLTAHTERMMVSGRRVTALYLIPDGFELTEDDAGYLVIEPSIDGVKEDKPPF